MVGHTGKKKNTAMVKSMSRVAFFPNLIALRGNPYWDLLATSLRRYGIIVVEENPNTISLKWLLRNRRDISILHYHYIQEEYAYEYNYARFPWVVRFFRNLVIARFLGYQVVWTMHNLEPAHPLQPAWVESLAHLLIARLANSVIVHCETARRILLERYGRKSGVVVAYHPHFIDVYPNMVDRKTARSKLGLEEMQRVILYFGGIRPNKGIEALLLAFKSIDDPHIRLIIAGNPQVDQGYIRRLMEQASEDSRVIFKSEWIPDSDLQIFFNAAELVVLPFASVLTSSSLALAMSFGRPVIVPNLGCMADLVPPCAGWIYEPENANQLAEIIRQALRSDLVSIGRQAYTCIETHSWDQFAQQTMLAYGMR